jgi:hypothetical protein
MQHCLLCPLWILKDPILDDIGFRFFHPKPFL